MSTLRDRVLAPHQVDDLVLLVGSNPLPNAVAGRLLCRADGVVHLVYTAESSGMADRLKQWLEQSANLRVVKAAEVTGSQAGSIYHEVCSLAKRCLREGRRVGLNYTGGTKPMAVHAYRAVEDAARATSRAVSPVFSYLDPRSLQLRFDPPPSEPEGSGLAIPAGDDLRFSIEEIVQLHGRYLQKPPTRDALAPDLAATLLKVHGTKNGQHAWRSWCNNELRKKCRKEQKDEWLREAQLRSMVLTWSDDPVLADFVGDVCKRLNRNSPEFTVGELAEALGASRHEEDVCRWLDGTWLESVVLAILVQNRDRARLSDVGANLLPASGPSAFEFDVAAVRGYQLFGFSCTTGESLDKLKLFEAHSRARQLGGDEARVALVCCTDRFGQLEAELRDEFRSADADTPQIRVFGRQHLANLADEIVDWIERSATRG